MLTVDDRGPAASIDASTRGIAVTTSSSLVRVAVSQMRAAGVDLQRLLRSTDLAILEGEDARARVEIEQVGRIWELAVRATGDQQLGLHVAEAMEPGAFDIFDYAILSSATLGDAIERAARLARLISDALVLRLEVQGSLAHLVAENTDPRYRNRQSIEALLATHVLTGRRLTGDPRPPVCVQFTHGRPLDTREHQRIFRAPVEFDARRSAIVFDAAMLMERSPSAADRRTTTEGMAGWHRRTPRFASASSCVHGRDGVLSLRPWHSASPWSTPSHTGPLQAIQPPSACCPIRRRTPGCCRWRASSLAIA